MNDARVWLLGALLFALIVFKKDIERTVEDMIDPDRPRTKKDEAAALIEAVRGGYQYLGYIPTSMVLGFIETESNFNPNALSHAGAKGLMQLMEPTFNDMVRFYHLPFTLQEIYDPTANVVVGMHHIHWLYGQLQDWNKTISAYNMGIGNMKKGKWNHSYLTHVTVAQAKYEMEGYA